MLFEVWWVVGLNSCVIIVSVGVVEIVGLFDVMIRCVEIVLFLVKVKGCNWFEIDWLNGLGVG